MTGLLLAGVGLLILAIALVWSGRDFDAGELDIYPDIYPADPWPADEDAA